MNINQFTKAMHDMLDCFSEENEGPTDNSLHDWTHAFSTFIDEWQDRFCPTCAGEGYCEEQTDVDYFKPYPCPDCGGSEWEPDFDDDPPIDDYRGWAGIEDPYYEPKH